MNKRKASRAAVVLLTAAICVVTASRLNADSGSCGGQTTILPFTDVAGSIFFCQIAEAYFSGLTNGTDATHYSPSANVTRDQMAAFITRTLDQSLKRGSERAALDQFWHTQTPGGFGVSSDAFMDQPLDIKSDGLDLWVADPSYESNTAGAVVRIRSNTGNVLQAWEAHLANSVLIARGKIFATGELSPGTLYVIDPSQPAGMATVLTNGLGNTPNAIAYDGQHIWTTNSSSVSKITLSPLTVENITTGIGQPNGILFDGANIWVVDVGDHKLKKLNSDGTIALSVSIFSEGGKPAFDGTNIWVPDGHVVRAIGPLAGTVLATLSGNGCCGYAAAFDGERVMIVGAHGNVSVWNATDFTPIDNTSVPGASGAVVVKGVCSDGVNFWITVGGTHQVVRY
jgi:hypothetical protein